MDKIPSIGGARGIFEIFVPGIFLLVNIAGAIYLSPYTDPMTQQQLVTILKTPALIGLVVIPFGYLAGIVLRLFRTEKPDQASALYLRTTPLFVPVWRKKKKKRSSPADATTPAVVQGEKQHSSPSDGDSSAKKPRLKLSDRAPPLFFRFCDRRARVLHRKEHGYAYKPFPYSKWLEIVVERRKGFPPPAKTFFHFVWKVHISKSFLNFCKVIVSAGDPIAAAEIYSAESFCRYISGMFYALAMSLGMLVLLMVLRIRAGAPVGAAVPALVAGYLIGLWAILRNFRFMRIKEVEIIFAASFKNRDLFTASPSPPAGSKR